MDFSLSNSEIKIIKLADFTTGDKMFESVTEVNATSKDLSNISERVLKSVEKIGEEIDEFNS